MQNKDAIITAPPIGQIKRIREYIDQMMDRN